MRFDSLGEFEHLRRRAARWVEDAKDSLRSADPDIPSRIANDRARDNWRPLLAIADAAGGEWPQLARSAALAFSAVEPETESTKVLLLRDMKALFEEHGECIESEKVITALVEIEGRPWAEGRNGKPLTKTGLARLLKPFGIHPKKWREGTTTVRGYEQTHFAEAFARYLDSETPQTPHATETTTYGESQTPQGDLAVAFASDANSNGHNDVAFVAFADVPDEEEFCERVAVMVEAGTMDEESAQAFEELAHDPETRRAFASRYMNGGAAA